MQKIVLVLYVAVFLIFSARAFAGERTVPESWITLPEEAPLGFASGGGDIDTEKLEKVVDKIFSSQYQTLSTAPLNGISQIAPVNRPKDWVPWRFVSFASDLTISAQGVLGMLTFKGTPGVSVYWQKRENFPKPLVEERRPDISESEFALTMSETTSVDQIENQVASMEKTIAATRRVKSTPALGANLRKFVHEFAAMASSLGAAPVKGAWYPSRLRVDLQIAASGDVSFGTAGGDVRVRLEWYRIQETPKPFVSRSRFRATAAAESSLFELVGAMSEDLAVLSEKSPNPSFEAKSFRVGLGVGAEGKIGVAKASARAFGHVYFSRAAKPKAFVSDEPSNDALYLVDSGVDSATVAFAKHNGIATLAAAKPGEGTMFKIDRARFRKGLGLAMKIGGFFTKRAHANSGQDWAISVVKPEFTMSVSGELGLTKLTGFATAQIDFQNKNF